MAPTTTVYLLDTVQHQCMPIGQSKCRCQTMIEAPGFGLLVLALSGGPPPGYTVVSGREALRLRAMFDGVPDSEQIHCTSAEWMPNDDD